MAQDVSAQLLEQVRASEYFALQLDKSTDVSNAAQLLVYIRFISQESFVEKILFCKALEGTISPLIQSHLEHMQGYFKDYFPDLDNSHQDWIRDPFVPGVGASLDMKSQEELIDMSNSGEFEYSQSTGCM
ncbi:hypothetical protein SKAU_G00415550 [Synaphobranchus kaupii]|uniref:Uncharacterized protein n=1 Tax=Synaphobranchus kaupii TaxID=118154 RepID=A0A9Q1E7F1_SYNKA|nr:hypothetical protein SKAU_G00415550 [Synaphobranchus kaupii]